VGYPPAHSGAHHGYQPPRHAYPSVSEGMPPGRYPHPASSWQSENKLDGQPVAGDLPRGGSSGPGEGPHAVDGKSGGSKASQAVQGDATTQPQQPSSASPSDEVDPKEAGSLVLDFFNTVRRESANNLAAVAENKAENSPRRSEKQGQGGAKKGDCPSDANGHGEAGAMSRANENDGMNAGRGTAMPACSAPACPQHLAVDEVAGIEFGDEESPSPRNTRHSDRTIALGIAKRPGGTQGVGDSGDQKRLKRARSEAQTT